MKANLVSIVSAAALLAVCTSAQHPMGFTAGWDEPSGTGGGTSVGHDPRAVGFAEGDVLTRIDADDYTNWGRDPIVDPTYATWCMYGIEFVLEDANLATPELPAWVSGWTEDPNNPNFPDLDGFDPLTGGSNFLFAGPIPTNTFPATLWTLTLPRFCVSGDQDIFLGVNLPSVGTGEGLAVHAVTEQTAQIPDLMVFDNPGPGGADIPEGSYVCVVPTTTPPAAVPLPTGGAPVYTSYLAQNRTEVFLLNAAGGVCSAATNQPSYEHSHVSVGEGTPNFLSGLHPDSGTMPVNPGRNLPPPAGWTGDWLGFHFTDSRLQVGDPVLVIIAVQPSVPPLPLIFIPGTGFFPTGLVLVSITQNSVVGAGVTEAVPGGTYVRYSVAVDLPMPTRAVLQNARPTLLWQAFGLNATTNDVHATGLVRQRF